MFNALGIWPILCITIGLNCVQAKNRTHTVKHPQFVILLHSENAVAVWLCPAVNQRGLTVNWSSLQVLHWEESQWKGVLRTLEFCSLPLCYFQFPVPGLVLFFSCLHPYPLPLHLSTSHFSTLCWHILYQQQQLCSSFQPSPTSCPILPQIWGFDPNFPSDPFLHTFLCFLKCWSCFAVFLLLFGWWREPVQECPRSSDCRKNVTNGSWWKRADKAQGWGWVKWFW